jgi:hypothetical protein
VLQELPADTQLLCTDTTPQPDMVGMVPKPPEHSHRCRPQRDDVRLCSIDCMHVLQCLWHMQPGFAEQHNH